MPSGESRLAAGGEEGNVARLQGERGSEKSSVQLTCWAARSQCCSWALGWAPGGRIVLVGRRMQGSSCQEGMWPIRVSGEFVGKDGEEMQPLPHMLGNSQARR